MSALEPELENKLSRSCGSDAVPCSESLSWDATESTYGGIWEMQTACGRVFRMDLHANYGLGFQAMRRIRQSITTNNPEAWEIAKKCVFRKVTSLHGKPLTKP